MPPFAVSAVVNLDLIKGAMTLSKNKTATVFAISAAALYAINVPLSKLLLQYLNPQNYLWGDFAAAAVMSALPITIVFLLAQRWLVNGLTAGGVKG